MRVRESFFHHARLSPYFLFTQQCLFLLPRVRGISHRVDMPFVLVQPYHVAHVHALLVKGPSESQADQGSLLTAESIKGRPSGSQES